MILSPSSADLHFRGLVFRIEVEGKVYNYKLKTLSYCKAGIVAYLGCVNQSRGKRPLSSESACCKATARLVLDSSLPELVGMVSKSELTRSLYLSYFSQLILESFELV